MCLLFKRTIGMDEAFAQLLNHQQERYVKRCVIHLMEQYAKTTDNKIDDALVEEIKMRLLYNTTRKEILLSESD